MISFSHVYKTYAGSRGQETHALRDLNVEIARGEFVFLTGPSGAGKTTFFRLLSAYDRATSGQATVAGIRLNDLSGNDLAYYRRKLGVVFQDFRLLKHKTVFENVTLPLIIRGESPNSQRERAMQVLQHVGLHHKANEWPEQLSGGEQQRVAIARALIHRPGLIIADEPTGNLDPELSEEIMDLFEQANAQGTTVVVATHDLELVRRRNKRTLRLLAGQITDAELAAKGGMEWALR
jgi:cell division transport system ATP-binding protein